MAFKSQRKIEIMETFVRVNTIGMWSDWVKFGNLELAKKLVNATVLSVTGKPSNIPDPESLDGVKDCVAPFCRYVFWCPSQTLKEC